MEVAISLRDGGLWEFFKGLEELRLVARSKKRLPDFVWGWGGRFSGPGPNLGPRKDLTLKVS